MFLDFGIISPTIKETIKEEFSKELADYNVNDMELFTDNVSLQITNWPDDGYNHVVIAIRIHYKGEYAGIYKIIFNLSGEVEDDIYHSFSKYWLL